jgi:lipid-A-disaccharide synthase-like uncharacterized protein
VQYIGWIGFAILVGAWIPQTLETIRRGYSGTNLLFNAMYMTASLLLTIYALLIEDWVFVALNALLSIGSGINLFYKLFPRTKDPNT